MPASFKDFVGDGLARSVRASRNSSPLIAHLRRNGAITPALSTLIADLLEGKVRASPKALTFKDISRFWLKANLDDFKAILDGDRGEVLWDSAAAALRDAGINKVPQSKGEVTAAAKILTARAFNVTVHQLDEALHPRAVRKKNR